MKHLIYAVILVFVAAACKETFEAPPQSLLQVSLLGSVTKKATSPKVSAIGVGRDSLWLKEESASSLLLPLSSVDSSAYVVSFDEVVDTIVFYHRTMLKYASMETGFYYEYKLDSIHFTHNRIDSFQIADSLITKQWHENIKFYLRPLSVGSN